MFRGFQILQETPYSRKVVGLGADGNGWSEYVLRILKVLRAADRANWHHRMVARVSRIGRGVAVSETDGRLRLHTSCTTT